MEDQNKNLPRLSPYTHRESVRLCCHPLLKQVFSRGGRHVEGFCSAEKYTAK